jgi:hypothetical protein
MTSMMVTATQAGSTQKGMLLRVKVLTGIAASPIGATASVSYSIGTAPQLSITTTAPGSVVYCAIDQSQNSSSLTAAAGTTLFDNLADGTNTMRYGTGRTTSATGTPGAVTVGASAPTTASGGVALLEVLPGTTITEDVSAPAVASTISATTLSSAGFSPPLSSLLVALVSSDGGPGTTTMLVSGGGLAWTEAIASHGVGQNYCGIWTAQMPAPGQYGPVVTATQGGSTASGMALRVMVLTQAAASQAGAGSAAANGAQNVTVTTTQTGSRVYGAAAGGNGSYILEPLSAQIDQVTDAVNSREYLTFEAASLTGTPGAALHGFTASAAGGCAALEVLTGGTLTEDGSAPGVASTTSAASVSAAGFTAPPGALLVALISANGGAGVTTIALSDTFSPPLMWAEQAMSNASGAGYAGVWTATVPSSGPSLQSMRMFP